MLRISKKELSINDDIRDRQVRLLDESGEQIGIMGSKEALDLALGKDKDLVKISPLANPPVCKIMDYGKYKFEQSKREKEARKKQKIIEVKEVRMTLKIDTNDFNTKLNNAIKFLQGGDKVKVSVKFRGREMVHSAQGRELLLKVKESCLEYGTVENNPKLEGRNMIMIISPKPVK